MSTHLFLAFLLLGPALPTPKASPTSTLWSPPAIRVSRPSFDAIVLDLSPLNNTSDVPGVQHWRPSPEQVVAAESGMTAFLRGSLAWHSPRIRADLPRYKRQYVGFVRDGRRLIYIQFFHPDSSPVRDGSWSKSFFTVMGGGDLFFRLLYDPATKRHFDVWVNAPK